MTKKTALITFHAPYNFGSALQAFSLQKILLNKHIDNEIINYRFQGQKDVYGLIRKNVQSVDKVKDILQFPIFRKKLQKAKRFEEFTKKYMDLTKEFSEPEELEILSDKYDVFISGSDQIWNKHANELANVDWKYMMPYLLTFTQKEKISYASSIGGMTDQELEYILEEINNFSSISAREELVANRLSKLLNRDIPSVLDPTLLLSKEDYQNEFNLVEETSEPFIFYYSLAGIKTVRKEIRYLKELMKSYQYNLVVCTPYAYYPTMDRKVINVADAGPIEFLNYMYNAKCIVTNSFHGTAFSINFNKPFYTISKGNAGAEYRKSELLNTVDLLHRNINSIESIKNLDDIDFSKANRLLVKRREVSMNYLFNILSD